MDWVTSLRSHIKNGKVLWKYSVSSQRLLKFDLSLLERSLIRWDSFTMKLNTMLRNNIQCTILTTKAILQKFTLLLPFFFLSFFINIYIFLLWRWLSHQFQSLSTATVPFRTTFTRTIIFNQLMKVHAAKCVIRRIEQSEISVIGEGLDCDSNYYHLSCSRWLATFLAHFSNLLQLVNLLNTATSNKCPKLLNIKLYHFLKLKKLAIASVAHPFINILV